VAASFVPLNPGTGGRNAQTVQNTIGGTVVDANAVVLHDTVGLPISTLTPSVLAVTATSGTGVAATATLPAVVGQFHYITTIQIELYATAARTGSATPVSVTSTNLPGSPAWQFDTAQAIGNTIRRDMTFSGPLKSSVVNTATTIVAPVATTGIWRINVFYYTAV
jgi:hypothetical protein